MLWNWDLHRVGHRLLFIATNVVFVLMFWKLFIAPLTGLFADQAERLAAARAKLNQYERLAMQEGAVRERTAQTDIRDPETSYLHGENDGAINANMEALLKSKIESGAARIQSIHSLEPIRENQLQYFGAHVDLAGTSGSIAMAIAAIESGMPYLFVKAATLRTTAAPSSEPLSEEPSIDAHIDVYGPGVGHDQVH